MRSLSNRGEDQSTRLTHMEGHEKYGDVESVLKVELMVRIYGE